MKDYKKVLFDDVASYDAIKNELKEFIAIFRNTKLFKEKGIDFPKGIWLLGEPGLGKTLMANAFINESGLKTFYLTKNDLNDKIVDSIKATFLEAIKCEPSIVFLDDIDKFSDKESVKYPSEIMNIIQSCIDECSGRDVFVLATGNDQNNIPDSLSRKGQIDKTITFLISPKKDRIKIIERYLSNKNISDDYERASDYDNFSNETKLIISSKLNDNYLLAKDLLLSNWPLVELFADALIKKTTITHNEIVDIFKNYQEGR